MSNTKAIKKLWERFDVIDLPKHNYLGNRLMLKWAIIMEIDRLILEDEIYSNDSEGHLRSCRK